MDSDGRTGGALGFSAIVFSLTTAYGLYRRRPWVVGFGYAACAFFGLTVLSAMTPLAIAAAWAINRRRENALY